MEYDHLNLPIIDEKLRYHISNFHPNSWGPRVQNDYVPWQTITQQDTLYALECMNRGQFSSQIIIFLLPNVFFFLSKMGSGTKDFKLQWFWITH